MTDNGGTPSEDVAVPPPEADLDRALAAVRGDADVRRTVDCTKRGIAHRPATGAEEPIDGSAPTVVVTQAAVYVFPDGAATDEADVRTIPHAEVTDADVSGLVRKELTITTGDGDYLLRPGGRPSLGSLADFLERAGSAWRRVGTRIRTVEGVIDDLDPHAYADAPEEGQRRIREAATALDEARSGLAEIDVAVETIEAELDRVAAEFDDRRARWHVLRGEDARERADHQYRTGSLPAALDSYVAARDHYQQGLKLALECELDGTSRLRARLEETRERLYDIETDPAVDGHEAVERALEADDPMERKREWAEARDSYRAALDAEVCHLPEAQLTFQLAWVEANYVRTCRRAAAGLESEGDDYAVDGHEGWASQLYAGAVEAVDEALSVARESDLIDADSLDTYRETLVEKRSEPDQVATPSAAD